jgi:prepilin-type N-terminal cleavage/methylation domain-containing protein
MTRRVLRSGQRGFTLVELMIVVGIIGILASVAIPSFAQIRYRSMTAERPLMLKRIKMAVEDYYVRNDTRPALMFGDFNPPLPPGTLKRPWPENRPGWTDVIKAGDIEGTLYYCYRFMTLDVAGGGWLLEWAWGDLDGDGVQSQKQIQLQRQEGTFLCPLGWVCEWPDAGAEDTAGF